MFPTAPTSKITVSNHLIDYHRPRLERHYVQVPQVLLRGYTDLSDGAKLTYQTLLSFDFVETHSDEHKGIVYPSMETLMALRRKSRSTIYSHLAELEEHGLVEVLIGEGFRLYNPQEEARDERNTPCPAPAGKAARTNHSAQESPIGAGCEDVQRGEAPATSTLTFQKSGRLIMEEEENQETEQYQYSTVGESNLVVDKLLKLGFDRYLAIQFVRKYGAARIDEQITNLCRALHHGVAVQCFARWLYRAIERNYTFPDERIPRHRMVAKIHRSIGEAKTLPNGDVVYEVTEYSCEG